MVGMNLETLKEEKLLKDIGLRKSDVIIIKRSTGIVILKKGGTLTDLLTGLVKGSFKEEKKEYEDYLLRRSEPK